MQGCPAAHKAAGHFGGGSFHDHFFAIGDVDALSRFCKTLAGEVIDRRVAIIVCCDNVDARNLGREVG